MRDYAAAEEEKQYELGQVGYRDEPAERNYEKVDNMPTKQDLTKLATKQDLTELATKQDLTDLSDKVDNMPTKQDLTELSKKQDQLSEKVEGLSKKQDQLSEKVEGLSKKQDQLSEKVEGVKDVLDSVAGGDVAPLAREMAEKLTVSAQPDGHHRATGHGLLVRLAGHENEIFFVSAAHIVIEFAPNQSVVFSLGTGISVKGTFTTKMYLPKSYVMDGTVDIGIVGVAIPGLQAGIVQIPVAKKNDCVGKVVVGKGYALLRGETVGALEDNTTRMLVDAISIEGCSGTPMFDNTPQLALALHGYSKHRTHRYKSGGLTAPSPHVFADAFDQARFDQVAFTQDNCSALSKVMNAIEGMEQSLVDDTQKEYGGSKFGPYPESVAKLLHHLQELYPKEVDEFVAKKFYLGDLVTFAANKIFKTPESEEGKIVVEGPLKLEDDNNKVTCMVIKGQEKGSDSPNENIRKRDSAKASTTEGTSD